MRMWSAPRGTRGTTQEEQEEESLIPWPDRDPEGADRNSRTQPEGLDKEGLDTKAETKYSLGGSHVFTKHNMGRMSCWE